MVSYKIRQSGNIILLLVMLVGLRVSLFAASMDLATVKCDEPWATFTTESNTSGIMFEDRSSLDKVFFLPMTNLAPTNSIVEMVFSMRTLIGQDRSSSIGLWLWDGIEKFGKDKSLNGHYLVLFDNSGNMDIKHWNGKYYSISSHKSRFTFNPGKVQKLKVETSKSGMIKVYINNKILMTCRTRLKIKVPSILGICATAGTWMEMTSFGVK